MRVREKFRFFIAGSTTCQCESPHKFSVLRPINRARVLLLGCKMSRCRASNSGVISQLLAGTCVFSLSSSLSLSLPLSLRSLPVLLCHGARRRSYLCVLFFMKVRGRLFLSRSRLPSFPSAFFFLPFHARALHPFFLLK